jgi:histidine triad (HIT) family protein
MKDDCLFCKIVAGEIPSYKTFEDDKMLAFLDVNPATRGHTLIIPKDHHEAMHDIPTEILSRVAVVAKILILQYNEKLKADGYNIIHSSKEAAQQEIDHFHLHLVPRYENDPLDFWQSKKENPFEDNLEETHKLLSQ